MPHEITDSTVLSKESTVLSVPKTASSQWRRVLPMSRPLFCLGCSELCLFFPIWNSSFEFCLLFQPFQATLQSTKSLHEKRAAWQVDISEIKQSSNLRGALMFSLKAADLKTWACSGTSPEHKLGSVLHTLKGMCAPVEYKPGRWKTCRSNKQWLLTNKEAGSTQHCPIWPWTCASFCMKQERQRKWEQSWGLYQN